MPRRNSISEPACEDGSHAGRSYAAMTGLSSVLILLARPAAVMACLLPFRSDGHFPEAITAVFPQATVQTCIVHLLRHSLNFVSWKDRKPVAAALKNIYRAIDADAGEAALTALAELLGPKIPGHRPELAACLGRGCP